jgi:hypothetical protein
VPHRAAPPFDAETGPSDARAGKGDLPPMCPRPCVTRPTSSFALARLEVGVIAATSALPVGLRREAIRMRVDLALWRAVRLDSAGSSPAPASDPVIGRSCACCAISSDEGIVVFSSGRPFVA